MDRNHKGANRTARGLPPVFRDELQPLTDRYEVRWDAENRTIILADWELPDGFTPPVIPVKLQVPGGYPQSAPRTVLPWCVRQDGALPRRMLVSGQYLTRGTLGDPIIFFPRWNQSSTLNNVVIQLQEEFRRMAEANPRTPQNEQ